MSGLQALLNDGRLADAIAAATDAVRRAPADAAARSNLAELLCLAGAFERAEAQMAVLAQQTVDRPIAIARTRHLIRAALARDAWFNDAAVPQLVAEPGNLQQAALRLAVASKAGDAAEVARLLAAAEETRPHPTGQVNGAAFDDLRDVDDRCAWFLDVLTHDGNYLWVDLATVESLEFSPLARPIDLLWREARMTLRDGRAADVVIPAQYPAPPEALAAMGDGHRLAQRTDWRDGVGGAVLGLGQRLWLFGDEAIPVLELRDIRFDAS